MDLMSGKQDTALLGLTNANNRLAFSILKHVRKQDSGNLFFSPWNILQTVAMAFAGARGETEREMARIVGANFGREEAMEAIGALNQQISRGFSTQPNELSVAYATWLKKGLDVVDDFPSLLRDRMNASYSELDFAGNPESATEEINAWVNAKTNGMIKDVITTADIGELTLIILIGAIYFLGKWKKEFDPSDTGSADFFQPGDASVSAMTMWNTGNYGYAESMSYRAVELPYKGNNLAMIIVLPKGEKIVPPSLEILGPGEEESITNLLNRLEYPSCEVKVGLPRFEMSTTLYLAEALTIMGMVHAFDPKKADFSGMINNEISISDIIHKARVKVDEQGTEAAAITTVTLSLGIADEEEIMFHVNRPFLFFIIDRPTGLVLFMGSVVEPEVWEPEE